MTVAVWLMYGALVFTIVHYLAVLTYGVLSRRLIARARPSTRPTARTAVEEAGPAAGVTVIMPAYNEEAVIVDTVTGVLGQDHPWVEVIVVNDGSKDQTVSRLVEHFGMEPAPYHLDADAIPTEQIHAVYRSVNEPRLVVVDKAGAGAKADNSNVGTNLARYPWVVCMDADELLNADVLRLCMTEALRTPGNVIAVGTSLLPSNGCAIDGPEIVDVSVPRNYWVGGQLVEYLFAFLVSRPGMAHLEALPIVSGGFGLFKREAVLEVGGWRHPHLGEDMDLCMRLHRHFAESGTPYQIIQVPEAIVWTEFPSNREILTRQRVRWHRGLRAIVGEYRSVAFNPRYGRFGMVAMPTIYLFEWWGSLIEAAGYCLLALLAVTGSVNWSAAAALFLVVQLAGMASSLGAVSTQISVLGAFQHPADIRRLLFYAVIFNWGYRQLTVWWRIKSLKAGDQSWGEMPRQGFQAVAR
ncbi:MAG: glycosyltransferase family 2 protein [Actinomycetia bacterium]|nr:glycosyltransferase family 2 protein [Actinomycetes bacterium]